MFADILFGVLLYYILFIQHLWMTPASKGALLNIQYYYYLIIIIYKICIELYHLWDNYSKLPNKVDSLDVADYFFA